MLILSWNVAGLSTTVEKIDKHYGEKTKRRNDPSAVICDYFQRHNADIVCIQEAKIPKGSLESRGEPLRCAHVPGYESFWSCCIDASKRGFNGVVTYCKKGTVLLADSRPLKNPDLDDQGRCVMTDHGTFVLFNVYVPCGGGQPLSYKMKFLHGLRQAMKNQRENHGKKVVLVGDLNITHTKKDIFWGCRKLAIDQIYREVQGISETRQNVTVPKWKQDLAR
jgi:exodeoxyribonuclease III